MDPTNFANAAVAFIFGGGLVAAYVAYKKTPAETQTIFVDAAKGAVVVQSTVIDELGESVERLRSSYANAVTEAEQARQRADKAQEDIGRLRSERNLLRWRVDAQEQLIRDLQAAVTAMGGTLPTNPPHEEEEAD